MNEKFMRMIMHLAIGFVRLDISTISDCIDSACSKRENLLMTISVFHPEKIFREDTENLLT